MKRILGLDLGTNSIGWALVKSNFEEKKGEVLGLGSRIIPMSKAVIKDFEKGVTKSQTAERTEKRGVRVLYERSNLRRERLHRILNVLGYLPSSYSKFIDFENKKGKFKENQEPLLPYSDAIDEKGKRIFLFEKSYQEMEDDFRSIHPSLPKLNKKGNPFKLPYDWTLYYLRKKALSKEISNEELAWILLNFNQKRGYFQERDDKEIKIDENKSKEYIVLNAQKFIETEEEVDDKKLFKIIFQNGWEFDKMTTKPEIWKDIDREFIVTTTINKDGSIKRSFKKVDSEQDWEAIKRKTEQQIDNEFIGKYIYESLLKNPKQKIKGELIRTIDRSFYFDELECILRTQIKYRKEEWNNQQLYETAINELYPNNREHQENLIRKKDKFIHLFLKDILFYHRPLKSQKSLISKCIFEQRFYLDEKTGKRQEVSINGIPKSHPLFQEFRIWQLVHNLKIQKRELVINEKIKLNVDVTDSFLNDNKTKANFFKFLYNRKEITQKQVIAYFIKDKKEQTLYRWNYSDDDTIKLECNETRANLKSKFNKTDLLIYTDELEKKLWFIIYSVTNKKEYDIAVEKFSRDNNLSSETEKKLKKSPLLKKDYASYSEKAIKELVSLMRIDRYWSENNISDKTTKRINKIIDGEFDKNINTRVYEKAKDLKDISNFQGLPLWLASYIVYGKHSEVDITQWKTSKQLREYIDNFKQHSVRNPIVEQILLESLRVTLDIWEYFGNKFNINFDLYIDAKTKNQRKSYQRLFDEIHIEIGRDLKKPKKVREKLSNIINKNKDTNQRVRKLLYELKNFNDVKDVKPKSKTQFDKLKIFEQTILSNFTDKELSKEVLEGKLTVDKFIKKDQPSTNEVLRYKLWLEQKYKSVYTQKIIRLSDLFTSDYEIEHLIPQSKYLDNSFNNKVICETAVNRLKDNRTAYAFMQEFQGTEVPLGKGKTVTISTQKNYEEFVKENYTDNKLENLLREDIPKEMVQRQKNDMRYISKLALKTYSNIVREDGEQESTVKNVLSISGGVTSILKNEWGLNAVWSNLVENRFKRLNRLICGEENEENGLFGKIHKNGGYFRPEVPLELKPDFQIKRIDHRHHALDALVIACANRLHINYINNNNAKTDVKRYDIGKKIRNTKTIEKTNILSGEKTKHIVLAEYFKPWYNFTLDTKVSLQKTIISFKQNLRAINKATNYNWRYKNDKGEFLYNKNGKKQKQRVEQKTGNKNWAIRKPLHEDTFFGIIENGKHKGNLVKREPLNTTFTENKIKDIIDDNIQKILLKHLRQDKFLNQKDENEKELKPNEAAFSPKGIKDLNDNIVALNNGKFHHPIKKIKLKFTKGKKFPLRKWENEQGELIRESKFVKSATNLYFCVYEKDGVRKYHVPLFEEILATQKIEQDLPFKEKKNVPEMHPLFNEFRLKFYLQPNDLVYIPKENDEDVDFLKLSKEQLNRIYVFKDGSGTTANFNPMFSADVIFNLKEEKKRKDFAEEYGLNLKNLIKNEYGLNSPQLKNQNSIEGIQVKSICWKLKVDRLGNIVSVIK